MKRHTALRTATTLHALIFALTHAAPAYARAAPVAASFSTATPFTMPAATSFSTTVPANRQSIVQLQGADAEGTALSFAVVAPPSHGAVTNLVASTGACVYTPAAGYTGADSFTFNVTSGGQTSATATVSLTVSNAKTTVTGTLIDASGAPRSGAVTFVLTQPVTTPDGIVPVGTTVSAVLSSSGGYSVQLYPSRGMSPESYYQVWWSDSASAKREFVGLYEVPFSTTAVGLAGYVVTDTNLARRYVFVSVAGLEALTSAVANATIAQLVGQSRTTGKLQKWDGANLTDSLVSESGSTVTIGGNQTVTGNLTVGGSQTVTGTVTAAGYNGIQAANVPSLDASKITSGTLGAARVPDLDASKITSGTLPNARTTATTTDVPSSIVQRDGEGVINGKFQGDGSGLTGITGGTGGVSNTGSTTIRHDSDNDGVGVTDIQGKDGVVGVRVENDATVSMPKGVTDATAPKLGVGAVNLAARATAGDGSSGTPYTGWASALSLSASDVAYHFPAKTFSFSSPLVFTGERVKINCERGAVLKFTGSGVAITSDGGATTGDVNGFEMVGCKIVGNASATTGLLLRSSHRVNLDVEITNVSQEGVKTQFVVGGDIRFKVSRWSSGPFTVTPVNGIVFDRRSPGEEAHALNVYPIVEWVSGDGLVCNYCHSSVFHAGTSEGNGGRGRYFGPGSTQNTIFGGDDEANGGDDLTVAGNHNVVINYFSNKATVPSTGLPGTGVTRISGDYNAVIGGIYDNVIIESTADGTWVGGSLKYNVSGTGTWTDNSTTSRYFSRIINYTTGGFYIPNFDLTPAAGWAHAGGAWLNIGYYKRGDQVFLRGCATGGSGTITTLPVGARPAGDRSYTMRTGATPAPGTLAINAVGNVIFASGTANLVCLDGVSFDLP